MRWWIAAALAYCLVSSVTAITLINPIYTKITLPTYTCTQTPSDSCSRGTCPAGQECGYSAAVTHVGGSCKCSETTTTTLRRCQTDPQTGGCDGYCTKGSVCTEEYGKCGCYVPTTTTTLQERCEYDLKNGRCSGYCTKGSVCTDEYGKCGCYAPTTTTRQSTTTSTTLQIVMVPPVEGVVTMLSTSTTQPTGPITRVTIPVRLHDADSDGITDITDNCPGTPNGPDMGSCINANGTCHTPADCGTSGFCGSEQQDFDIDGVGDACDLCQCISCTEGTMPGVDYYGYNDKYGCGCDDSDGGNNEYVKGTINRATPPFGDNVSVQSTDKPGTMGLSDHPETETPPMAATAVAASTSPVISDKMRLKYPAAYINAVAKLPPTPQSDYNPKHYTDYCKDENTVMEYYCDRDGLHSAEKACPYGCVDGRCSCTERGDGDNRFQADALTGDVCLSGTQLKEGYYSGDASAGTCTLKYKNYDCVLGCAGGKCRCGDSDGGVNVSAKGTTALDHSDRCQNINTVVEYSITVNNASRCMDTFQNIACPTAYACYDGACKPASCLDGQQDGNEAGVDCGGSWCPPCSPCATGARWAPTDGPCTHKWPTSDGPGIGMNTGSDSCNLVEVCDNNLDYIVEDALKCCENQDYAAALTAPRESSKEDSCDWARTVSGVKTNVNPTNFKKCTALYTISAFGYGAIYMQGYFHGEWCCYDSDKLCPGGCERFKVRPTAWQMGTSDSCDGDGGAHPDYNMGGHRCEYNEFIVKWGKAGHWSSDTDWHANSDSVVDVPAHASIDRLSTGTCVDYSFALTTMLRKLGYSKDDVFSVNGEGHGYNLLRFPGEAKFHYVDTVGNRGGEVFGGTGFNKIVNQSAPGKPALAWYDYCRKMDDGCSNDAYGQSTGRCPANENIYGCEGVPR
jgi:hypothetical protein